VKPPSKTLLCLLFHFGVKLHRRPTRGIRNISKSVLNRYRTAGAQEGETQTRNMLIRGSDVYIRRDLRNTQRIRFQETETGVRGFR
jgi:hypothetical protein